MSRMFGTFALCSALIVAAVSVAQEGEGGPRPKTISGTVSKVDSSSLTLAQRREGGAEQSETFQVDAKTKILIETDENETVTGEGGNQRQAPKKKVGKLDEVKTGSRAQVSYVEAGKATAITVFRAPPARKGEGDR